MNGGAIILAATQKKKVKVKYRNTTYFAELLQKNPQRSCSDTSAKQILIF